MFKDWNKFSKNDAFVALIAATTDKNEGICWGILKIRRIANSFKIYIKIIHSQTGRNFLLATESDVSFCRRRRLFLSTSFGRFILLLLLRIYLFLCFLCALLLFANPWLNEWKWIQHFLAVAPSSRPIAKSGKTSIPWYPQTSNIFFAMQSKTIYYSNIQKWCKSVQLFPKITFRITLKSTLQLLRKQEKKCGRK